MGTTPLERARAAAAKPNRSHEENVRRFEAALEETSQAGYEPNYQVHPERHPPATPTAGEEAQADTARGMRRSITAPALIDTRRTKPKRPGFRWLNRAVKEGTEQDASDLPTSDGQSGPPSTNPYEGHFESKERIDWI